MAIDWTIHSKYVDDTFFLNPDGLLCWKNSKLTSGTHFHIAGEVVLGSTIAGGYKIINVYKRSTSIGRVVLYLHNGVWPAGEVDHIDGNPGNNALGNLRDISRHENRSRPRSRGWNSNGLPKNVKLYNTKYGQRYTGAIIQFGLRWESKKYQTIEEAITWIEQKQKNYQEVLNTISTK